MKWTPLYIIFIICFLFLFLSPINCFSINHPVRVTVEIDYSIQFVNIGNEWSGDSFTDTLNNYVIADRWLTTYGGIYPKPKIYFYSIPRGQYAKNKYSYADSISRIEACGSLTHSVLTECRITFRNDGTTVYVVTLMHDKGNTSIGGPDSISTPDNKAIELYPSFISETYISLDPDESKTVTINGNFLPDDVSIYCAGGSPCNVVAFTRSHIKYSFYSSDGSVPDLPEYSDIPDPDLDCWLDWSLDCNDYTATFCDHSFMELSNCYFDKFKTTDIFGVTNGLDSVSVIGDSKLTFYTENYGSQEFDFANVHINFGYLKSVFFIVSCWVATQMFFLKKEEE